jgi:two-component system, OmpR family, response regulator
MLVLSRKLKEKIILPTVSTIIQVLEIKAGTVRLGIDAPPEVTILREEVPNRTEEWGKVGSRPAEEPKPDKFKSQLRDRLKAMGQWLGLTGLQLDSGLIEEARASLARIQDDLQVLRYGVEGELDGPPSPRDQTRKPQKALLVEDDRNERELLAGFLRRAGLDVDTAGDGSDALEYLGSHGKPDVVLLDMGLPRVDGPTMVREIRRNPAYAGLKIFGVTGHLPEEFDLERGPRGIDGWFQKPLDPTALLHDLQEELSGSPCGA